MVILLKNNDITAIKKAVQTYLYGKRYDHTLAVAYIASALAMNYSLDLEKAFIAGLLHDCAKCLSDDKKISICEKNNILIFDFEKKNPSLLHSKIGGYLAIHSYNIHDDDIINAIVYHTTGRPKMSDLEKIIFIADYIEPGRKQANNLDLIRKIAFENLDDALILNLKDTLG